MRAAVVSRAVGTRSGRDPVRGIVRARGSTLRGIGTLHSPYSPTDQARRALQQQGKRGVRETKPPKNRAIRYFGRVAYIVVGTLIDTAWHTPPAGLVPAIRQWLHVVARAFRGGLVAWHARSGWIIGGSRGGNEWAPLFYRGLSARPMLDRPETRGAGSISAARVGTPRGIPPRTFSKKTRTSA